MMWMPLRDFGGLLSLTNNLVALRVNSPADRGTRNEPTMRQACCVPYAAFRASGASATMSRILWLVTKKKLGDRDKIHSSREEVHRYSVRIRLVGLWP